VVILDGVSYSLAPQIGVRRVMMMATVEATYLIARGAATPRSSQRTTKEKF
jgi:hypothetical protein